MSDDLIEDARDVIEMLVRHLSGSEVADDPIGTAGSMLERIDAVLGDPNEAMNRLAQESLMHPAVQVYFRAGLFACREYIARFVEKQNPAIAASIRANWWPALGDDPGPPRLMTFQELTEREYGEPGFRCKGPDEISPSIEALAIAWHFLNGTMPGSRS